MAAESAQCIANIGPRERRRRLVFGLVSLVVGALALAVLVALDVSRVWRLLLFVPFAGATVGYFQAREKT